MCRILVGRRIIMDRKENMTIKKFYDCAEEIAQVLDKYLHNPIEDMDNINNLIEKEKSIDKFIAEHGVRPDKWYLKSGVFAGLVKPDELDERATQNVQPRNKVKK